MNQIPAVADPKGYRTILNCLTNGQFDEPKWRLLGVAGILMASAIINTLQGSDSDEQVRRLNIHEYQGAELMGKFGINVPKGVAVSSLSEIQEAIKTSFPDQNEAVVKSQILVGGRRLGKMLGQLLITKQTGPQDKVVNELIIACSKGGTSIEDLAEKYPNMIIKVPIDVFEGITDAAKVVDGLNPKGADRNSCIEQVKNLYQLFCKSDCTMLEINLIAETAYNQLVAADAELNFDDNAAFRQKDIFGLCDAPQEVPREVTAAKADLNYIGLDREIGCTPANFLDVGGNASEGQVSLKVPVVVRLEGTNVDQGKRIIKESGMALITAEDLDDAADKAVKAASK
ncbi:hypothetical protein LUZ60_014966 [Juncus effusus]|nr:hypothetical protein LUZ60_014966 [Juncus effusus]